jgi:hypothetical protein
MSNTGLIPWIPHYWEVHYTPCPILDLFHEKKPTIYIKQPGYGTSYLPTHPSRRTIWNNPLPVLSAPGKLHVHKTTYKIVLYTSIWKFLIETIHQNQQINTSTNLHLQKYCSTKCCN